MRYGRRGEKVASREGKTGGSCLRLFCSCGEAEKSGDKAEEIPLMAGEVLYTNEVERRGEFSHEELELRERLFQR